MTIDPGPLAQPAKRLPHGKARQVHLDLELFDGLMVVAEVTQTRSASPGIVSWTGHLADEPDSQVTLAIKSRILQGNIRSRHGMFQIRYVADENGDAIHALREIDPRNLPPEHPPGFESGAMQAGGFASLAQQDAMLADDGSVIDVMAVYTPAARSAVGGVAAMEALIALAVTETNQGYSNSGVQTAVRLVHQEEVSYTESGSFSTDVSRLRNTSDGHMDNVHALRDAHDADLVGLLIDDDAYCGIAYAIMATAADAFQVTAHACATGYYSFAHEFGHLQGARHDWRVDGTNNSPFTYNHGYVKADESWRTIMAYNDLACVGGYCTRLQYWSNPDIDYNGDPMGVPEGSPQAADNRKTLNNTAATIANFRASNRPANDDFAAAVLVPAIGSTVYGTNVDATAESGEPVHAVAGADSSVWWRWQAAVSRLVHVNTHGSDFDTVVAVYSGSSVSALTGIASNDDDGSANFNSGVLFQAQAGTDYYIAVAGGPGEAGQVTLEVDVPRTSVSLGNLVVRWTMTGDAQTVGQYDDDAGPPEDIQYLGEPPTAGKHDMAGDFLYLDENADVSNGLATVLEDMPGPYLYDSLGFLRTGSFTIAGWARSDGGGPIFSVGDNVPNGANEFISISVSDSNGLAGGLRGNKASSDTTLLSSAGGAVTSGEWFFYTLVRDYDNAVNLYLDGTVVAGPVTDVSGVIDPTGNSAIVLGGIKNTGNRGTPFPGIGRLGDWFDGALGETLIWDKALSSSQVSQLYAERSAQTVETVDIIPASTANEVHPNHDGGPSAENGLNDVIPVVVFGSVDFAVNQIRPETVGFGPGRGAFDPASTPVFETDFDSDGQMDASFDFLTGDVGIGCSDTDATLAGETYTGGSFSGAQPITADCDAGCHN